MKKVRNLVIAVVALALLAAAAYIGFNFILPSLITEVAVTGVPTPKSDGLSGLKTAQFQTQQARTTTPRAQLNAPRNNIMLVSNSIEPINALEQQQLYASCTTARGATATPEGQTPPTPEATAAPTVEAAATPGESNFVFLTIAAEESEACFQATEILYGNYTIAVGMSKSIAGEIAIDLGNVANSQLGDEINVNLAELQSDQRQRDRWVISAQGFNFNQFPIAKFTEAKLVGLPAKAYTEGETLKFQITGKLTIRDKTIDALFETQAIYKEGTLVATAYFDAKITDLGLTPPDLGFVKVNDNLRIVLNLVAREKK